MSRRSKKPQYCICRSTDGGGHMVCCDRCDEWFHYRCIGLTLETAPGKDEPYFCDGCKEKAEQCRNPRCVQELTKGSKYCSETCGLEYNKIRYLKHFRPKMDHLAKQPSAAYKSKMMELEMLDQKKAEVIKHIGVLRVEREELAKKLKEIKDHVKELASESCQANDQDMDESDGEEEEDIISSDQTKTFCVICGVEQQAEKAFKHWTTCYKKQESSFISYLTTPVNYSCETDPEPVIYCQQFVDRKKDWYCPNLGVVCPQHTNFNPTEGEICGCPLNLVQDLDLEGSFCLKLKKDCTAHYQWDRFRLATKDYERALAFQQLHRILDDIHRNQINLNEHYGGVLGVMLHKTIDETGGDQVPQSDMDDGDEQMIDVDFK